MTRRELSVLITESMMSQIVEVLKCMLNHKSWVLPVNCSGEIKYSSTSTTVFSILLIIDSLN